MYANRNKGDFYMEKEYSFWSLSCGKCFLKISKDKITIKRKGILAFLNYGLKGEKTILINQISAIQLKPVGFTLGYLQFAILGSQENKGGLSSARKDENTVVFGDVFHDKKFNQNASEIKEYIENFISNNTNNSNTVKNNDDKLAKLKKLLEDDIISEEEFKNEIEKILNQ